MSKLIVSCLLCALACSTLTQSLPALSMSDCALNDEDCRDEFMHPDMPVSKQRKFDAEFTSEYWLQNGEQFVQQKQAIAEEPQRGIAKNVIFFLGDGMSLTTLAATRIYLGGEEVQLSFEKFPDTGLAKTYAIDRLVPDSACTATAYLCGVKAMYGTIGVNGRVSRGDCAPTSNRTYHVDSIAKWALDAGKSAGLVTTTRVTHASPAGLYAHTSERDWENDQEVRSDCGKDSGVEDIALQLIHGEVGSRLKVVMGGGHAQFVDKQLYANGKRADGHDLIEEFLLANDGNVFVNTKSTFEQVTPNNTNRFMGIFNDDNLLYHLETNLEEETNQPTLSEMTKKAIELLAYNNSNGYFLFVEGGMIDKAHHETKAKLALDETAEFNKAVALARELTDQSDTLIIVSSDHSHTMSISGYAPRGNDIFGIASSSADDNVPYLTLSYANGPMYQQFIDSKTNLRVDPQNLVTRNFQDAFPATFPMLSETHGGEDVAVFASGPWSHLFSGAYEQSTIPHLLAYAACIGHGQQACQK